MDLKYQHLIGRPFNHGVQDCFSLARDFYKDNFDINIRNIARPDNWWNLGMNLYMDHFYEEGFRVIDCHPKDWLPADGFLIAMAAPVACHAAVYLGNNMILHHAVNRFSEVTPYSGLWRNNTVAVLRHKDVPKVTKGPEILDLMQLLPPHKRAMLEKANGSN